MDNQDHHEFTIEAFKILGLGIINIIAHNYHVVAANILVTISIGYVIWKWRGEYLKSKKEEVKK